MEAIELKIDYIHDHAYRWATYRHPRLDEEDYQELTLLDTVFNVLMTQDYEYIRRMLAEHVEIPSKIVHFYRYYARGPYAPLIFREQSIYANQALRPYYPGGPTTQ